MLVRRMQAFFLIADARHDFDRGVRAFAKADERVGECFVRMHRHVSGDVVEDVGLREIVEGVAGADGDRRRKLTIAQAVEEKKSRNVAAHCFRFETRQRAEELVHVAQVRDARRIEREGVDAGEEMVVRVAIPARAKAGEELLPGRVIGLRIKLPGLIDEDVTFLTFVLDEAGMPRGEAVLCDHNRIPPSS